LTVRYYYVVVHDNGKKCKVMTYTIFVYCEVLSLE